MRYLFNEKTYQKFQIVHLSLLRNLYYWFRISDGSSFYQNLEFRTLVNFHLRFNETVALSSSKKISRTLFNISPLIQSQMKVIGSRKRLEITRSSVHAFENRSGDHRMSSSISSIIDVGEKGRKWRLSRLGETFIWGILRGESSFQCRDDARYTLPVRGQDKVRIMMVSV